MIASSGKASEDAGDRRHAESAVVRRSWTEECSGHPSYLDYSGGHQSAVSE